MEEIKLYHANGQLCEHCYKFNGKLQGEYNAWYDNGQLATHKHFVDGELHGEYKRWFENGQMCLQTHHVDGRRHGECKAWDTQGNLINHSFWLHGKDVTEQVDKLVTNRYNITQEERTFVKLAIGC